jgi:hypothetical protein
MGVHFWDGCSYFQMIGYGLLLLWYEKKWIESILKYKGDKKCDVSLIRV